MVELNFRKCKLFLLGTYHTPSELDQLFFENVDKILDMYSCCDKILLTLTQEDMTLTWKLSFINLYLEVSLNKKLALKTCQTQVV